MKATESVKEPPAGRETPVSRCSKPVSTDRRKPSKPEGQSWTRRPNPENQIRPEIPNFQPRNTSPQLRGSNP